MTKSQQERLGVRLVASSEPSDDDLAALHGLLAFYGGILEATSERIRSGLGIRTTSRLKNTGTILEKLRRSGGATLKSMQDLAGMRIVGGPDRSEQDETVARVAELFRDEDRTPKVIDRRAKPVHGYSAVHVIVFPQGVPVEVQVRTTWQHEWAEVFEKLADVVGRNIRYGSRPERVAVPAYTDTMPPERWADLAETAEAFAEADHALRAAAVERALQVAGLIAQAERSSAAGRATPSAAVAQTEAQAGLVELQATIDELKSLPWRHATEPNTPPTMLGP